MRFGIDYAWHVLLDSAKLQADGVTFAARYYATINDSKRLTPAEAKVLSAAGIDIVTVWETTATRAEGGAPAGAADAAGALAEARAVGQPIHSGIYAAVDEQTTVGPHISAYFGEFTRAIHAASYRSGVYGSYIIVEQCLAQGLCDLGWQTYAWSGGLVSSHAALYQYSNGHHIAGLDAECDFDRSLRDDFGQWRLGAPPPPPPGTNRFAGYPLLRYGAADLGLTGTFPDSRHPVATLQNALNIACGFEGSNPNRIASDGHFGPATNFLLGWFQAHNGLAADYICGPATWAKLDAVLDAKHR